MPDAPAARSTDAVRFTSLVQLSEYALRERPESRAAWLGIQVQPPG
jgi:hypothetical protein